jgi:hypothetical protein
LGVRQLKEEAMKMKTDVSLTAQRQVASKNKFISWIAVLILGLCVSGQRIRVDEERPGLADEPFTISFQAGQYDANGQFTGGTEANCWESRDLSSFPMRALPSTASGSLLRA